MPIKKLVYLVKITISIITLSKHIDLQYSFVPGVYRQDLRLISII